MRSKSPVQRKEIGGIAMLEMAIVLPIVLMLMLPIGEIGRAYYQYCRLSHRVHAAAIYAAENALLDTSGIPKIPDELELQAKNLVVFGSPSGSGVPAVPDLTPSAVDVSITDKGYVRVQLLAPYPYQSLVGGLLPMFGFGDDISTATITFNPETTVRPL